MTRWLATFSVVLSQIAGTKVAGPDKLFQNGIALGLQFHNRGMVRGFIPVRQMSSQIDTFKPGLDTLQRNQSKF